MFLLTNDEQATYTLKFIVPLKTLPPGLYYIKSFFGSSPSVPRIARKFYEDVSAGVFKNVALVRTKSSDGYIVT